MSKLSMFMLTAIIAIGSLSAQETKKKMDAPIYNFIMKTLDGKERSLADFKGKVVMINFWTRRCMPFVAKYRTSKV